MGKILILYIPVVHKGYLDFLEEIKKETSFVYIISDKLLKKLSEINPDIAALRSEKVKELLKVFGFENVKILSEKNLKELKGKKVILVNDSVSRSFTAKYLKEDNVKWKSVFLRWDKDKVLSRSPLVKISFSKDPFDIRIMKRAYDESLKSADWWRQVGAVLVKGRNILFTEYNMGILTDHEPYQLGSMRDFFKAGENQEFSPTIHAEQIIVAKAANEGVKIKGTSLYVTHFPCPLCAKLIAFSGIKKIYFSEGDASFEAERILQYFKVKIFQIEKKIKNKK
ncbi:MAG: deaminase [Candidatus Pacebacteria bacterium]|jgi:dCMP deaminase|nr:deaminase [Candidatus Paceibacterota bacterium]MDD3072101.1 deaminase [Candidatus Paceibacterota bacterium]MDD4201307.1 deaminase [Candidatus Paceibacterota bacterium]MDD4897120.1 deaminase [Candidatus Paceibacterota bacterium]MDD5445602.1 deaminase [Candidatus Paceibacterota bacterium]